MALGTGLLAGIGVGEGVHGLMVVAATTSPVYWTGVGLLGVLLALWGTWRLRRVRLVLIEVAVLTVVAALLYLAYELL